MVTLQSQSALLWEQLAVGALEKQNIQKHITKNFFCMFACFYSSCIYSFARVCFCRFNKVVVNSSDGGREVLERKESLLIWSWKRCQWRDVGCLNGKGFCPRGLRGYVSSLTEVNFSILALTWHARTSPAPLLTKHDLNSLTFGVICGCVTIVFCYCWPIPPIM